MTSMLKAAAVQMDTTEMEDSKRREMKKPKNVFEFVKRCFVKRGGIFFSPEARGKKIQMYGVSRQFFNPYQKPHNNMF